MIFSDVFYYNVLFVTFRTDLNHLTTLVDLNFLDVSGNKITEIGVFNALSSMSQLEKLVVYGNPVCSKPGFLSKVFAIQPSLLLIDDHNRQDYTQEGDISSISL